MLLNLISLIPKIFGFSQDIMACLDGDVTEEDWDKVVKDLGEIALAVPQVAGFVAIVETFMAVAKSAFPLIEYFLENPGNMPVAQFAALGPDLGNITKDDLIRAKNSMRLMGAVSNYVSQNQNKQQLPSN